MRSLIAAESRKVADRTSEASGPDAPAAQPTAGLLRPSAVPTVPRDPDLEPVPGRTGTVQGSVDGVQGSPGEPLGAGVRTLMEQRLGADFGHVRIHADHPAAAAARALGAAAYTAGNSIVFGPGRYRPDREEGRELLAHELVHTIQQDASGPPPAGGRLGIEPPGGPAEAEAQTIAKASRTWRATTCGPRQNAASHEDRAITHTSTGNDPVPVVASGGK